MDIHGKPRNVSWTKLNATALAGTNQIVLETPVNKKISFSKETILNWEYDFYTLLLNSVFGRKLAKFF
jgi:hypothetical protein